MAEPEARSTFRVAGIVLAAGRSSRFGRDLPKQLHKIGEETMVCRAVRTALESKLDRVLVVAGYKSSEVGAAVAGLAVEVIVNADFAEGQSTSVKAALERIGPHADAAVFIPCDLPNLTAAVLDRLLAAHAASGAGIVVPVVSGRRFAPVLIDRSLFPAVATITGDRGAKQIFPRHEQELLEVEFESPRPFQDLDRLQEP